MRSILVITASGIDRAQLFMLRDVNAPKPTNYNSSGLTNEKWNGQQFKMSYLYLAGFKKAVERHQFVRELPSGDARMNLYEFKNQRGDLTLYAVLVNLSLSQSRFSCADLSEGASVDTLTMQLIGQKYYRLTANGKYFLTLPRPSLLWGFSPMLNYSRLQ